MVKYNYDAWGNCNVIATDSITLANLNPYRYRSYYFDTETGLYFLKTRYYDPQVGRFISIDNISYVDFDNINGINLYAYCGNNPVMDIDPNGNAWWNPFSWDWKRIGKAIIVIGATVAAVAITVSTLGSGSLIGAVLIGSAISVGADLFGQTVIDNKSFANINWKSVLVSGVEGAISGLVSFGVASSFSHIGRSLGFSLSNMTHISSGVKIGKVFSANALMIAGEKVGKFIGGFLGGMMTSFIFNDIKKENKSIYSLFDEEIQNSIPSWIIEILG